MLSGDRWTTCSLGHRHWGAYGAAGILVRYADPARGSLVLLQHRATWSHHGGTWGLPGGARDRDESAEQTALREADEEIGIGASVLELGGSFVDDHGGWTYTTVAARCTVAPDVLQLTLTGETEGVAWVPSAEVESYPLHPGFAGTWSTVRALPE